MSYENGFVNIARHREICVAHMTCKGAAHAVYDARVVAKQICCIPRHPSAPRPARLERLPKSLTTLSWLEQAHHELGEGEIQDEREAASASSVSSASLASSAASAVSASSAASSSPHPASASGQLARFSALARARLPRWPPHLLHHLELVLIARAAASKRSRFARRRNCGRRRFNRWRVRFSRRPDASSRRDDPSRRFSETTWARATVYS